MIQAIDSLPPPPIDERKASLVIPCYNRAKLIRKAVESVLSEAEYLAEIVIVDDGSTDDTPAVLAALAQEMPLVRIVSKPNGGVASARNAGVQAASAPWVAFLDSDDWWLPGKLQAQFDALAQTPGARLCGTRLIVGAENSTRVRPATMDGVDKLVTHLEDLFLHPSASLIQRDFFLSLDGFDESLETGEDTDLFLRALAETPLAAVEKPYAHLYKLSDGLSNSNRVRTAVNHRGVVERFIERVKDTPAAIDPVEARNVLARWSIRVARVLVRAGKKAEAKAELRAHRALYSGGTNLRAKLLMLRLMLGL